MQNDWAAENLQVIRTLMERSALYRRALAPTMLFAGTVGVAGALAGMRWVNESTRGFLIYWMVLACVALAGSLLLVRRQALREAEPVWTPPARRVVQALAPALSFGLVLGVVMALASEDSDYAFLVVFLWIALYGCALHAAGFFMPRGIRWFGWINVVFASASLVFFALTEQEATLTSAHLLMGAGFGVLHLLYGAYLVLTEKRKAA